MDVLIACEESQAVCKAFRELGHRTFSADLQECSGGHPEWHIVGDCLPLLNGDCDFTTQDGRRHRQQGEWQLIVGHPPCTYISRAGARWMYPTAGQLSEERLALAMDAKAFFFKIYDAKCKYIAIENPRPLAIVGLPKPSTIIQPYEFGEPFSKATYLWLKNLPPLMPTLFCGEFKPFLPSNPGGRKKGRKWSPGVAQSAKARSKTFPGIAKAMAAQWSDFILNNRKNKKLWN